MHDYDYVKAALRGENMIKGRIEHDRRPRIDTKCIKGDPMTAYDKMKHFYDDMQARYPGRFKILSQNTVPCPGGTYIYITYEIRRG